MPNDVCHDSAAVRTMLGIVGHCLWNYIDAKPDDWMPPDEP